jgi:hypothetical protein
MANTNQVEFLTPVGRLVQGSPWILNDTDREGKPLVTQDGKPKKQCFFALAIEKTNPEWPSFWTLLSSTAQAGYPQFFGPNGCIKPDFAWKVSDGDGNDNDGKPNNVKPGWAGCWVVKFSSSFLPRCFEKGKYQPHQQLKDDRTIKPGYFIRVGGLMSANIGSKKAGLYLNADLVELNFVGEEITFGRDASAALGNAATSTYVPAGAMQLGAGGPGTPNGMQTAGPGTMGGPGTQSAGAGAGMGPGGMGIAAGAGAGGPGSMAMPGTHVQGNPGFVAGAMQAAGVGPGAAAGGGFPFAAGGAQQQRQQPQYAPTPKAAGYTMEQFLQNGFNVQQLLEQGFFVQTA